MQSPIRVRFAPAPTGNLHIGSLRTTLFNWLFARHNGGSFLLRVEDTDRQRSEQQYTDSILESLAWLGLMPDEPILIQSSRLQEHLQLAHELVKQKKAYYCICTQEELLYRFVRAGGAPEQIKYDGLCRNKHLSAEQPHVIRFAIPDDVQVVEFADIIRGSVTIQRDQLDDFIIVRSDGTPMYNFVVVADDAYMHITHIIRGEEHIINTPKQILLYQACGYTVPQFAHIPLVLGQSGQKLSKREAATAVIEYKKAGFLPEALINYLVRLGWSHGDQEKFTRQELIDYFDLAQVSTAGAIFDIEKLLWLNSVYLREKSDEELYRYMHNEYRLSADYEQRALLFIALYKERVHTLKELYDAIMHTIQGPSEYADIDLQPLRTAQTVALLKQVEEHLRRIDVWSADAIMQVVKAYAKEVHCPLAQLMNPVRVALIGKSSGPGVGALAEIVGKQETLCRVVRLYDTIEHMQEA